MRSPMRALETVEEKPLPRLKRGYDQGEIAELRSFIPTISSGERIDNV